jgi:hypothetical protein
MTDGTTAGRGATLALALLGAGFLGNGLWMLADAGPWFARIASETGAFNGHLVRDVGAAYAAAGVALVWGAARPELRGPLAAVAAVFLGIHALVHVVEAATGALPAGSWVADLPGVHLPALLVAGLALQALRAPTPEVSR